MALLATKKKRRCGKTWPWDNRQNMPCALCPAHSRDSGWLAVNAICHEQSWCCCSIFDWFNGLTFNSTGSGAASMMVSTESASSQTLSPLQILHLRLLTLQSEFVLDVRPLCKQSSSSSSSFFFFFFYLKCFDSFASLIISSCRSKRC